MAELQQREGQRLLRNHLNKFRIPGSPDDRTCPECGRTLLRGVYVALFGISRGAVNVAPIALKMPFRLDTRCRLSSQVLPDPL
jgi:hypothetical protein